MHTMADQSTKLNAETAKLFTFVQIGAAVNEGKLSEKDAASILVNRAKRKATAKGVKTPA